MADEPKLEWGQAPRDLLELWPKGTDGTPEKPVLLTTAIEAGSEADMTVSMLRAYGIPVLRHYARDGTLGKVVLGFSGYGADLYVPESMLEDAKNLIQPVDDPTLAEQEEEHA